MKIISKKRFNPAYYSILKISTDKCRVCSSIYFVTLMIISAFISPSFGYSTGNASVDAASANQPYRITAPLIQQANRYEGVDNISAYWVSEKLDGVRARWTGTQLVSRNGHPFNAPAWFTAKLPNVALDGELWIGRGQFDRVSGIVRQSKPNDKLWQEVKFMLFDLPSSPEPFTHRIKQMQLIIDRVDIDHLQVITQRKLKNEAQLQQLLDKVIGQGAEGLMLHHGQAMYQTQRVAHLLKVKKHQDAEAVVIAHLPGKGKFKGMLGAIKVRDENGIEFKIGTGFSNEQRDNPPPIGSVITFKYFGKTSKNKPRFASFMRVRYEADSSFR